VGENEKYFLAMNLRQRRKKAIKRSLRDFVADSRMKPLRHISMENNELCKRKKGMKIA
jgi:hypothetical protein